MSALAILAACVAFVIKLAGGNRVQKEDLDAFAQSAYSAELVGSGTAAQRGMQGGQDKKSVSASSSSVTVCIRPDDWCTRSGPYQRKYCVEGELKRRLSQPYMTISEVVKGLTNENGAWSHEAPLNGWSGFANGQLQSLHCTPCPPHLMSPMDDTLLWTAGDTDSPVEALSTSCPTFISIWALPTWTKDGFAESAPGFFLWFSPARSNGSHILLGKNALQAEPHLLSQKVNRVALWGHEFQVGLHHAVLLLEWEDKNQPVTLVDLNLRYNSAKRLTNYYEDGLSTSGRFAAALNEPGLEGMNRPPLRDGAEIRMFDLDVRNLTEFWDFVGGHSRNGLGDTRFRGSKVIATDVARHPQRTRADIVSMILNYLWADGSFRSVFRNCQTFAIELFAAITVTRPKSAFLLGNVYALRNFLGYSTIGKFFEPRET